MKRTKTVLKRLPTLFVAIVTLLVVTVTGNGLPVAHAQSEPGEVQVRVHSAVPGNFVLNLSGFTVSTAAVAANSQVALQVSDPLGNVTPVITIAQYPTGARVWYSQYTHDKSGSIANARITASREVRLPSTMRRADGIDITFLPETPNTTDSTISVNRVNAAANGQQEIEATVRVVGWETGAAIQGNTVQVLATPYTGVTVSEAIDRGDGSYVAQIRTTVPGEIVLTASVFQDRRAGPRSVESMIETALLHAQQVTFDELPASAPHSHWSVTPESELVVGESFTAYAQISDELGNKVGAGEEVTFHLPAGVNGNSAPQEIVTRTDAQGEARTSISSETSGSFTVSASVVGQRIGEQATATFVAAAADRDQSNLSVGTPVIDVAEHVAETATATVELRDRFGNAVTSADATVEIQTSHGAISPTRAHPTKPGYYVAEVSGLPAEAGGTAQVTFTIDGERASSTQQIEFFATARPAAPTVVTNIAGVLRGEAQSGTTVTVSLVGGSAVCQIAVSESGSFTCPETNSTADSSLAPGDYELVAHNADGLASPTTPVVVLAAPSVTSTHQGNAIGTADPHQPVTVRTRLGATVCETVADTNGEWVCDGIDAGIFLVDQGTETHRSAATSLSVTPSPVITQVHRSQVFGTGIPGAQVSLRHVDGSVACAVTMVEHTWECASLVDGDYAAVQVGTDGSESRPVVVAVDTAAPAAPQLDPSYGDLVSGRATPDTTVRISTSDHHPLCEVPVAPDGQFQCAFNPRVENGTLLEAVAVDARGNESEPGRVRVGGARLEISHDEPKIGDTVQVYGAGFLPHEKVTPSAQLQSWLLEPMIADPDGNLRFELLLEEHFDLASYRVSVTGEHSGTIAAMLAVLKDMGTEPGGTPDATDVTDVTDATDVTDVTDEADVTDVTDVTVETVETALTGATERSGDAGGSEAGRENGQAVKRNAVLAQTGENPWEPVVWGIAGSLILCAALLWLGGRRHRADQGKPARRVSE